MKKRILIVVVLAAGSGGHLRVSRAEPPGGEPDRGFRQHRADRGEHRLQNGGPADRAHGGRRRRGEEGADHRAAGPRPTGGAAGRRRWRPSQSAESQLAQAETAVQWQRASLAADIWSSATPTWLPTRRGCSELRNGSRPQEKLDAKAAVDAAQSEVERAGTIGTARRRYIRTTTSRPRSIDQYRNRWESATAALNSAKEREALVLAGPRIEQVNAAKGQVERARGALKMAEANALEMKRREQEIGHAARRYRTCQGDAGADRFAACRYHGGVSGGWRGAGEIGGRGRDAGARHDRGHGGRYRPPLAARATSMRRIWAR